MKRLDVGRSILTVLILLGLSLALGPARVALAQANLLANANFEEGSYVYNNDGDQRVPNGWLPWWTSPVTNGCYNSKPHYEIETHPPHVKEGSAAARYYTSYSSHKGGLMQQVSATPGVTYQFSIYGFAWSTNTPIVDTPSTAYTKLWVGIDPTGGTDGNAASVVWSPENAQMDTYGLFTVQAKATSSKITVFTRSRPDWCMARNDSFWDAASLVATSGTTAPPTQPPAPAPSPSGGVTATASMTLNIRSGPGISNSIISYLPSGATATVTGRAPDSQWIYITYNGVQGWVAGWLCSISGDLNSVPIVGSSGGSAPPPAPGSVAATANVTLNIRNGPGATFGVVGYLPGGATVPVLGRNGDSSWVFIDRNGTKGWVAAWLCSISGDLSSVPVTSQSGGAAPPPSAPSPSGVTATATISLNLRSGPGTSYAVVGVFTAGATAPIIGRAADSNWINITYNGQTGWVAGWLCSISGDLNSVPVTSGSSSGSPAPPPPASSGSFALGGQVPGSIGHPDQMHSAKMSWVKFQIVWMPGVSPDVVNGQISAGHGSGFKVILGITGPLYPGSIDYSGFANFVKEVAQRGPDAIEVWNEQNLSRQWPAGQVNPASYVNNMLKPAYQAIKAGNPNVMVISGALAPTGVHDGSTVWADDIYLAGMRDAGAAGYMDCLGIHYNAGATSPDATSGHPADGGDHHYSWYYQPMVNLYSGAFPTKQLCFTEMGYLSPEGYPYTPPMFWWGGGTSVAEQADWLSRAVYLARTSGKARLVIVFNVDFTTYGDDPQAGYAIIRPGGGCPACSKLAGVMP